MSLTATLWSWILCIGVGYAFGWAAGAKVDEENAGNKEDGYEQ